MGAADHDANITLDIMSPEIVKDADHLYVKRPEDLSPEEVPEIDLHYRKVHEGHDAMHFEMVIIFFVTVIAAQIILMEWKRRAPKSYQMVTLLGMWLIPIGVSLTHLWWRFVISWLIYSCITSLVVKKALEKPIQRTTPRLVYKWFYFMYTLSYGLGVIGYILLLGLFLGLQGLFGILPQTLLDVSIVFLFYGIYYGILGQDMAEISSDKMASHIGYYSKDGMPTRALDSNICAVCANRILVASDEEGVLENTYKLSCDHVFHEFCIRGWCIVGKKQICPYCKEKVDLKKMFSQPWEKPHVLFGSLLDWIRVLVAWQPVILAVIKSINYVLGLE